MVFLLPYVWVPIYLLFPEPVYTLPLLSQILDPCDFLSLCLGLYLCNLLLMYLGQTKASIKDLGQLSKCLVGEVSPLWQEGISQSGGVGVSAL